MAQMINADHGVYVFIEHSEGNIKESSLLIICEGRRLAQRLGEELSVILLGKDLKNLSQQLNVYGVDKALLVENSLLENYIPEIYANVLIEIATQYRPSVILFATTPIGSELASRVASKLSKGIITNCKEFVVSRDGSLTIRKPICDEKVDATVTFLNGKPFIATINPDFLELEKARETKEPWTIEFKPAIDKDKIRIRSMEYIKADPKTVDVSEADVVVGIGKGLGSEEHLDIINKLADLLGASIGGSRIARDKGWIPYSSQIGSSGKKISPKL